MWTKICFHLFLRIFCPTNCKTQPSYWSPVIGNNIYTDVSKTVFWMCMFWMNFCKLITPRSSSSALFVVSRSWSSRSDRKERIRGSAARWSESGFVVLVAMESDWITVLMWLMENGSNGEVSQRVPGMYYPACGLTAQRLFQALSQTKCLCLIGRRHRKKQLQEDCFTSSLQIHLNQDSRLKLIRFLWIILEFAKLAQSHEANEVFNGFWFFYRGWNCPLMTSVQLLHLTTAAE